MQYKTIFWCQYPIGYILWNICERLLQHSDCDKNANKYTVRGANTVVAIIVRGTNNCIFWHFLDTVIGIAKKSADFFTKNYEHLYHGSRFLYPLNSSNPT